MVFFTCNDCKESLNKTQIKRHLLKCKNCLFTCIDCQQLFNGKSFRLHLNCFDKTEKECGVVNYIDMAINKNLEKSTIFQLFDVSSVSMDSSHNSSKPDEESEYYLSKNFKLSIPPSQLPNTSSVSMDTSLDNKKPDKMQRLLDELEEEFEKQKGGKLEEKTEAPRRKSYKLSPINPIKLQSKARRKILQIIPETPEKQIENSQKREEDDSFEVVKQTPIGKISSENSILASKLSELLLQEEAKIEKIHRKRKLNFSAVSTAGIEEKRKK